MPSPRAALLRKKAIWLPVVVVALIAVGASSVRKQLRSGNDFPNYHAASRALLAGRTPYDIGSGLHGYVYLPAFALVLAPLAALPLPVAAAGWFIAIVLFAASSIRITRGLVRETLGDGRAGWALAIALAIVGRFVLDNLALGQANLAILALTLLATERLMRGLVSASASAPAWDGAPPRATDDLAAGALVGLAATIKPYAILLLAPLAIRGRWRALAGAASAFAIAATLLPAVALGPARAARLAAEWSEKIVAPLGAGSLQGSKVWDQSPHAALRRLVVDEPAFGDVRVNAVAVSPETFRMASRALGAGLLALFSIVWIAGRRDRSPTALLFDLALADCGMVTLLGANLKAQFVVLLLPWTLLAASALSRRTRTPSVVIAVAWVSGALMFASSPGIVGRAASNWLLAYSAIAVSTLLLAAALAVIRLRPTSAAT